MDFSETQEQEENHFVQDEDEIDIKCLLKEGKPTEGDIDWIVREINSNPDEKKKLFELLRVNDDDPGYNSGDSIDNAKDFTDGMTIPRHLLKNQTYEELAALLGESPLNRRDLAVKTCCIQKDLLPTCILARGNQAVTAYRGALTSGETLDNRVKVILIGEGQVGKTSVAKALRGEKFEENERSVNGILMSEVIKNATHDKPWRNSATRENARPVSSQTNGIDAIEGISLEDEVDGARSNSPEIELVVWELSGQGAYRAIHPMFMTPDAVYVLVFDLSKGLFDQATAKDNENGSATNSENEDSNLDCIMRWMDILNSMRYSAADEILPPVLLVGTHADCVNGNPRSIMDALLDRFRKIELGDQIKGNFVLDNTLNVPGQEDPQVAKLRRRILDEANKLPHAMKKIPRKWFEIERKIQIEAKRGIKYYTTKEVFTKKVCQTQDLNEIDQILLFLCDRRSIIYHENASKEDGLVVLDPQWLVGRLCKLLSLPPEEEDKIEFRNLRKELRETGILHQKLLHRTCTEWEVKDIEEALVSLMKHYNLLFHCPRKEKNPIYLVPCLIKRATGENEVIPSKNGSSTSPPIYLIFGTKFVPIGLFSRLAMLIGAWAAKKSSIEQLQINADTACFILDGVNFLELKCFKSVIQVQVWSEDSTRQYSDPGLYSEIYCCLERSLKAVCATCHWLHSVSWDLSVQCRLCAGMVNLKTRKCIWHDKRNCHHEDCAHYIPLKRHIALFCQQAMKRLPEEKFERWVQASGKNNSQEETGKENIASTNEITVLLLAEEWGSGKGGLSTINRQLAIELARYSNLRIYFYVIKSNEEDKQMAKSSNINIIKAKKRPGYNNGFERLSFPPEELPLIDVVVGHGVKLGKQAQLIKVKHSRCVWVQFEHTAPEELGTYKNYEGKIARGESKHRDEVDLAKRADVVAAIGPKLTEYYKTSLRPDKGGPEKVFEMIPDPSMFHEFRSCKQVKEDRENFNVLIFGRGDSEDFKLKGFDIAARAVAELNDEKYHLYAVGAPHGQQEDVEKKLLQCDISRRQLTVRGFIECRDEVAQLLCEVDLAIMPSRTEGFGLTALEALAAGLPILVGKNSGFAKALQKINESACIVNSEDSKEWANAIRFIKEKPRSERLQEAKRLKERCESEFAWSRRCQALTEKILLLVEKKSHNKDMKGEQRCEVAAVPEGQEEDETQNQSQTTRRPDAVEEQEPTGGDEGYSSSRDRTNSTEFSSGHEETSNSPNAVLNVRRNFHADTEDTRLNEQQNGSQLERDENQETGTSQKNSSTQGPRQRKNLLSQKDCDGEMTKEMTFSSIKDLQCWRTRSCLILVILAMLIVTALCFQK